MANRKKVLIAEDDVFISEVYFTKLSTEGFDVSIANDGKEALEKMEKDIPDILLLDILMPNVDGWEVLRSVRKQPQYQQMSIIMLTNMDEKTSIEKALTLGANDYLVKSYFTPEEVVTKIKKNIK